MVDIWPQNLYHNKLYSLRDNLVRTRESLQVEKVVLECQIFSRSWQVVRTVLRAQPHSKGADDIFESISHKKKIAVDSILGKDYSCKFQYQHV